MPCDIGQRQTAFQRPALKDKKVACLRCYQAYAQTIFLASI